VIPTRKNLIRGSVIREVSNSHPEEIEMRLAAD